ncbi:MAG: GntR family transcriptional regulator [Desulfobacula sp.]|uniref:GntR family transcriptional regulator n=1 Tax=Desulfobacula sp. TaxID=2593537 RepID=UPI0025B9D9BB|nr:GntR family transcriptional regulator [Desulfobacula sp.]MCD4721555.1 GntR family transcriptional regulator [Desulfobacula sp.]
MEIKTVTNIATEYLRKQIITGKLVAGQKLNETDLALHLNISRPPIREAFRTLENEHLIVSMPRKGTNVSEISIEYLQDVYKAREMLECYAIDILKAENIRELPNVIASVEAASNLSTPSQDNREEVFTYLKAFVDFHIKLIESTGNNWMVHFYNSISSHLARYQFVYLYVPGSGRRSTEEHQHIISLIKRGSYEKAKKFMREHVNYTFEFLRNKMLQTAR